VITRAYLVGGAATGADDVDGVDVVRVIGGLPNLLRQALSLQDAGLTDLVLIGISGASLRADRRLRLTVEEAEAPAPVEKRLRPCRTEDEHIRGEASAKARAGGGAPAPVEKSEAPALVARAGCIWHPAVVGRLARTAIAQDAVVTVGSADAAVYLCGKDRVAEIVSKLGSDPDFLTLVKLGSDPHFKRPTAPEFVIQPRTDADRHAATTLLLRSLEKQADGFVSRHLHRPLSRAVTRRLLSFQVTPNAMTLFAAVFGIAGVIVAVGGGYWNILIGALLFEIQNVLDGCDGEIARLKYLRSRAGEWLDQVVDDVLNIAFLAAVGVALSRAPGGHDWAWRLTVVAVVAQVVHVIGLYSGLILKAGGRGSVATLRWWVGGTSTDKGNRLLGDLTRRDFYSLLYLVSAALNVVAVPFVWHALMTIGAAIVSTLQWIAWNGPECHADADGVTDPAGEAAAQAAISRASR
jgi:phosphatidylglycerophosphate synthase